MIAKSVVLNGVVHGNRIDLDADSGIPDGERVTVHLTPSIEPPRRLPAGEGLRRAFGGWSEDQEGLDEFLKQMRTDRDNDPRNERLP